MPGLLKRRFPEEERLKYDSTRDIVHILGGYRGAEPIVAVRKIVADSDIVQLNDMMAFDSVEIKEDSIVSGNILSGGYVSFSLADGNTFVNGDVGAMARSEQPEGAGVVRIRGSGTCVVYGNILAREVHIEAPSLILGNVVGLTNVSVNARSIILGKLVAGSREVKGEAVIKDSSVFQIYVHGNLTLEGNVTVFMPLIAARNGDISVKSEDVRVMSLPCYFCNDAENPFLCEHYLSGACPRRQANLGYDYLSKEFDLQRASADGSYYSYMSWYWRSSPLMIVQNVLSSKLLYKSAHMKFDVDMAKKTVNGHPLSELPRRVIEELVSAAKGGAAESIEQTRSILFSTIEEFFQKRGIEYRKCPHCGAPNPKAEKLCLYCGKRLE